MKHKTLLTEILDLAYFTGEAPVIPYLKSGSGKLVVVTGDNASGKSFFGRVVSSYCSIQDPKIECMRLSMEGRHADMGGLRSFVYGDEGTEATSLNSIGTVLKGIKTCEGRTKPHVIFWDEPDLGLADGAAAGLGVKIREFAQNLPRHTVAAFVVTHNKALVAELAGAKPTFLHLGDAKGPSTLKEWLERPVVPVTPEELKERSRARYEALREILRTLPRER